MKFRREISAGGIVYKKERDRLLWLITKHSLYKKWSFPKGLIGDKETESKEKAALREVEEEGGIKAEIVDFEPAVATYKYRHEDYLIDKTVYYYLMEYISGNTKNHDWEVEDARFVTEKELQEMLVFESDKQAFKEILQKVKK